jgi:hypothetical protein
MFALLVHDRLLTKEYQLFPIAGKTGYVSCDFGTPFVRKYGNAREITRDALPFPDPTLLRNPVARWLRW